MKKLHFLVILLIVGPSSLVFCQTSKVFDQLQEAKKNTSIVATHDFFDFKSTGSFGNSLKSGKEAISLSVELKGLRQLNADRSAVINLTIPIGADTSLYLELIPVTILASGFKAKELSNSGELEIGISDFHFFRGIIKDDPASLVSITLVDNELYGFISDQQGTRVLGKKKDSKSPGSDYLLYFENDLNQNPNFSCDAIEIKDVDNSGFGEIEYSNNCASGIGIYFEVDNSMYATFGSNSVTVQNYVLGLFNQVSTMYANENINVFISELSIWTTSDPYQSASTTSQALNLFKSRWNSQGDNFPGQLAHLLSTRSLGGGIAYLDVLCNARNFAYAVSAVNGYYQAVPTYSWDVMVLTHELGHNFGSRHTQSCTWPGGAIDNCYTTEGGCPPGPAPVNGGTVMSYCHLTPNGINLANGFGPLPGNYIRNRYAAASCRSQTNTSPPTNLTASQISASKAILSWVHPGDFTAHTIQYRLQSSSGAWTEISNATNNFQLGGLTRNTGYSWRVKGACSDYSSTSVFSTNDLFDPYCEPVSDCSDNDGFNGFTLNGVVLSSNTGCSPNGYSFVSTAAVSNLLSGATYNFSATLLSNFWPEHLKIWIDYNADNVFDENEVVYSTTSSVKGSHSATLQVAANKPSVLTRMRIRAKYNATIGSSCENYTFGETEDYPVRITAPISVCESVGSGSWTNASTWSCGRVPLSTDNVIVKQGHSITINAVASAKSLEVHSSSKIEYLASGSLKLNH